MGKITAAITGVGLYLPDYILTNEELSTMVDTSDEWIMSHIGVKTRHILKGEGVGTSYMGARAVINLLDKAGVDPMEVDLVICATVTPDMFFPSTGNLIADQAGCKNAFAYDVSAACSGFLFALTTGAKFIESGSCKKVVVVGADKMSTIVDYTDRSTCPIFGDGAAAVLLEPNTEGYGVLDEILRSDGSGELQLYMKAGGSRYPASIETVQNNWHTIMWDGHAVFKAAVSKMADVSVEIMERNNLTSDDIRYLVPHQANLRIIDATARRMGLDHDKCMINIDRNGNTTAATIPSCLYDYEKELKPGDNLILSAFGGGYTWGAIYVKWAYDGAGAADAGFFRIFGLGHCRRGFRFFSDSRSNFAPKNIAAYENPDRGRRTLPAGDHGADAAPRTVCGRAGVRLRIGARKDRRIRLRLYPAGHHAARRQRPADTRRAQAAAKTCRRDHHFGPGFAR